jgi:hypothetical protein
LADIQTEVLIFEPDELDVAPPRAGAEKRAVDQGEFRVGWIQPNRGPHEIVQHV